MKSPCMQPAFCNILMAFAISFFLVGSNAWSQVSPSPLAPPDRSTPIKTLQTFHNSMQRFESLFESDVTAAREALNAAISCLELDASSFLLKEEKGREASVFLKEVLDRIVDINKLAQSYANANFEQKWLIPSTEIELVSEEGINTPVYLVSAETVDRLEEFYDKVKHLPYISSKARGAGYKQPWLTKQVPKWAKNKVFSLFIWQWLGIAFALCLGFIFRRMTVYVFGHLTWITDRSKNSIDDKVLEAIRYPAGLVVATLVWLVSIYLLAFKGKSFEILFGLIQLIFSVAVIRLCYRLSEVFTGVLKNFAQTTAFPLDDALAPIVERSIKAFIIIFGSLLAVQNLGVNVMSLMAGLGLGGLAFALAAKDTAANLFGSLMILIDRPFSVGDWITVNGVDGTVVEVGLRSTRIETFYNSMVSIPNATVANESIDNMGKRRFRRIKTDLGLTYDTTPEEIEAFLEGCKRIVQANHYTRKDYFHVVFSGFGASSLNIMLYAFLEVPNWSEELVQRQNIYLEILRLAKKLGIVFAFPSSSIYLESTPDKPLDREMLKEEQLKEIAAAFSMNGPESHPSGLGIFKPPHLDTV